jgi:hypothetical protein
MTLIDEARRQLMAAAPSHCAACGTVLIWLQHERPLKPAPIEAEPVDDGNILLLRAEQLENSTQAQLLPSLTAAEAGFYRIRKKDESYDRAHEGLRYRSHFIGCKHAPHFRDGK